MQHVYFHPRDDKGAIKDRVVGGASLSDEETIRANWKARYHLTAEELDIKWQEFLAEQAFRWGLEQQHLPADEIDRQAAAKRQELMRGRKPFTR